jgi:tRNA (guanine-N7-)-methyltransferase
MRHPLREYPDAVLNLGKFPGKIDFAQVFGRAGPVHIEIGCGRGTFLAHEAQARPQIDFIGIERALKYFRHSVDRIGRRGLTNVRIVWADAETFLRDFVPEASVDAFHIYFPDPWPKKRQRKRRFVQAAGVETLIRCLKPGGTIQIATDHQEYFQQIQAVTSARSARLQEIEFTPPAAAGEGEWTGTNYERKYLKDGRPVCALALRKIA